MSMSGTAAILIEAVQPGELLQLARLQSKCLTRGREKPQTFKIIKGSQSKKLNRSHFYTGPELHMVFKITRR